MSYQGIETLSKSELKAKLNKMGMSLDRNDHPKNYYKKLYLEKSNAKNKVTRDNTPFYQEQIIINKKRQRTSSKKSKPYQKIDFNAINEEEDEEEYIPYNYSRGIKTTRLIESKKKIKPQKKEEIYEEKRYLRSSNKLKPESEIIKHDYNLRSTSKHDANYNINNSEEKNIIKFGAQSDDNNNINNKKNNIPKKSPQKAYYLRVRQNINEPEEKPILIEKKKKLLNRLNEIKDEEIPSKLDQYRSVEDGNIITYDNNNNNEISTKEQNAIISETSSYNSNATSRFSRFTNYTFMSFSRLGNNIVNAKNCVMNKFRRNAYLFPLIILIVFGIVFFLNERYQNYDRNNIIIIFSIIMGIIILFNLIMYFKRLHNFKKIAKSDKKELMNLFEALNINKENMGDNTILLNKFIEERIKISGLGEETYFKYVFPYLIKYLKKDGFYLEKIQNEEKNNNNYWKEL